MIELKRKSSVVFVNYFRLKLGTLSTPVNRKLDIVGKNKVMKGL